jgi:hypothetical protein
MIQCRFCNKELNQEEIEQDVLCTICVENYSDVIEYYDDYFGEWLNSE